uniref:Uncharacterized protein n=1 Tax=Rhizophora mucronata TaxID=61149 RepID=A0A2P2P4A2_RHIMU
MNLSSFADSRQEALLTNDCKKEVVVIYHRSDLTENNF